MPKRRQASTRKQSSSRGSASSIHVEARRLHLKRKTHAQTIDESLRAETVEASEAGLRRWKGNMNRTDYPEVDTPYHREAPPPTPPKPKVKKKTPSEPATLSRGKSDVSEMFIGKDGYTYFQKADKLYRISQNGKMSLTKKYDEMRQGVSPDKVITNLSKEEAEILTLNAMENLEIIEKQGDGTSKHTRLDKLSTWRESKANVTQVLNVGRNMGIMIGDLSEIMKNPNFKDLTTVPNSQFIGVDYKGEFQRELEKSAFVMDSKSGTSYSSEYMDSAFAMQKIFGGEFKLPSKVYSENNPYLVEIQRKVVDDTEYLTYGSSVPIALTLPSGNMLMLAPYLSDSKVGVTKKRPYTPFNQFDHLNREGRKIIFVKKDTPSGSDRVVYQIYTIGEKTWDRRGTVEAKSTDKVPAFLDAQVMTREQFLKAKRPSFTNEKTKDDKAVAIIGWHHNYDPEESVEISRLAKDLNMTPAKTKEYLQDLNHRLGDWGDILIYEDRVATMSGKYGRPTIYDNYYEYVKRLDRKSRDPETQKLLNKHKDVQSHYEEKTPRSFASKLRAMGMEGYQLVENDKLPLNLKDRNFTHQIGMFTTKMYVNDVGGGTYYIDKEGLIWTKREA